MPRSRASTSRRTPASSDPTTLLGYHTHPLSHFWGNIPHLNDTAGVTHPIFLLLK